MALDKTGMAAAIQTQILSIEVSSGVTLGDQLTDDQKTAILNNWELICDAIISYFKSNMLLTFSTHTHSGVLTGGGVSGPPSVVTIETGAVS
jgi:hypothetical protein